MQQDALTELLTIAIRDRSRDRRVAARLLIKAMGQDILREHIPELRVVAVQELGPGVGTEFERLAKEFNLLPTARDRMIADLKR
jgi:hypothetical protein